MCWSTTGVLADAMRRELERGGQVYYLHNRVETIDRTAARIGQMLGGGRGGGVAHGKMSQEAIDDVMSRMTDGELNVLVCTTIIETGIDLPNANTLIIEDADHLGLAQLHQIRGRVGRSNRRAFAYLTYRRGRCSPRWQLSACRPSGNLRSSAPASRSPCGTWRSGARATCWARAERLHAVGGL